MREIFLDAAATITSALFILLMFVNEYLHSVPCKPHGICALQIISNICLPSLQTEKTWKVKDI